MNLRSYGESPFSIVVLHGGPGAPREMAPVARELSSLGGVLEPLQIKLSLEGQIIELHNIIEKHCNAPVTLIGWSWGAILGYMFSSRYPSLVRKLILVSSGVFEEKYAANIMNMRLARLTQEDRNQVVSLMEQLEIPLASDKDTLLYRAGKLIFKADSYEPLSADTEVLQCYYATYHNVWQQASELRRRGVLLQSGRNISCLVVALHGDYDPHPPEGIREPLSRVLKDFHFILLEKCGHYPWLEKEAKRGFYHILKNMIEA